jgi:hypothetical protein
MSPRVIQLPMSGRDRKHYVRELRAAERAHAAICERLKDAIADVEARRLASWAMACEEWNLRQFIGGPAANSPRIVDAIDAGFPLLEVQCRRCARYEVVDLKLLIWPRENQVHTLANVLRCQRCTREGSKSKANLIALRKRPEPEPDRPAAAKRRSAGE